MDIGNGLNAIGNGIAWAGFWIGVGISMITIYSKDK